MESTASYASLEKPSQIHWLLSCFLGLILFACGNFMLSEGLEYPFDSKLLVSIGNLVFIIIMLVFHMLDLRLQQGFWPSFYPTSLFTKDAVLAPGFFYGVLGGVLMFLAQFSLILGWYWDPTGRGITFVILSGITPIVAFLSFLIFNEKLTILQIIGMIIAIAGIALLSAGKLDGTWVSLVCAFVSLGLFATRNLSARAMQTKGMGVYTGGMINAAAEALTGLILLAWMIVFQEFEELFAMNWLFYKCSAGVVVLAFGMYFINQAIMTGNIGVVLTIINTNGMIFLLLDLIFYDRVPGWKSLVACFVIIFGVTILLLGDSIKKKIVDKKNVRVQGPPQDVL